MKNHMNTSNPLDFLKHYSLIGCEIWPGKTPVLLLRCRDYEH
jgi:hypothetical protein